MSTLPHILRRTRRSLLENAYLNSVAAAIIGAALLLMGVYLTVQVNLNALVSTWNSDVHVSAYFAPEVPESRRFLLRDELAKDPQVAQVRYVSEAEAEAWLSSQVEEVAPVLAELGPGVLPASLEVTLRSAEMSEAELNTWAAGIQSAELPEVDYGQEWIDRFNSFLSMLKALGAGLGVLILVAALFVVTNTIYLIVYNRRDELEIQKLVGATHGYIVAPFLFEGVVQGLVGAAGAMGGLWALHQILFTRLAAQFQMGAGAELLFLPPEMLATLALVGVLLGVGAALVAVQRFWAQAA